MIYNSGAFFNSWRFYIGTYVHPLSHTLVFVLSLISKNRGKVKIIEKRKLRHCAGMRRTLPIKQRFIYMMNWLNRPKEHILTGCSYNGVSTVGPFTIPC